MPTQIAQPTGLEAWLAQYGNIVAFFAQVGFWLIIAVVAIVAVVLFKRLVDIRAAELAATAALFADEMAEEIEDDVVSEDTDAAVDIEAFDE